MTLQYLSGKRIIGLAADAKPSNVPANSEIWEIDTGKIFFYNGVSWIPKHIRSPYKFIVYREPPTTYCVDSHGYVVSSSSSAPETPIQYALDNGIRSNIWVSNASYSFSAGFTGLNVTQPETHIKFDAGAFLTVPSGYTGKSLIIDSEDAGISLCQIEGGRWAENTTTSKNWDGIYLKGAGGSSNGVNTNRFYNMFIRQCNRAILLETTDTGGWINGNSFKDIFTDNSKIGVEFIPFDAADPSMDGNEFYNVVYQCSDDFGVPSYGFKNIAGNWNSFYGCKAWDMQNGGTPAASSSVATGANHTMIYGGIMTSSPADWEVTQDYGTKTYIISDGFAGINTDSVANPFIKKTGAFTGVGAAGDGILSQFASPAAPATSAAPTTMTSSGLHRQFDTSSTINTLAGIRAQNLFTARLFNPILKTKVRLNQLTDCRFLVGFCRTTTPTFATGSDPFDTNAGYGIGFDSTSAVSATNWLRYENSFNASSTITDTGIAADTNVNTIFVAANDNATKWMYRIGNNAVGSDTTGAIPSQTLGLTLGVWIDNTAAASKTFDLFAIFMKQDK